MIRKTVLVFGVSALVLLVAVFGVALNVPLVSGGGTIYIRADGSVYPPTANITSVDNITYTFTDNINDSIVIERDNIVVDGAGYTIQGTGSGTGINLTDRYNVTIRNTEIKAFSYGIYLSSSNVINISQNNVTANKYYGIILVQSSNNALARNKVIATYGDGIWLSVSSNNSISGNSIANNWYGIWLGYSSNNTLAGNVMNGNGYNFGVSGDFLGHFIHSIDASNLVNDKPVYYLINQTDTVINPESYPEVGYLGLVNCANITVERLSLTSNFEGLLLAYTSNSKITANSIVNNWYGIWLQYSSNNALARNNMGNNLYAGIRLLSSSNNTLDGNSIVNNLYGGVYLSGSSNNTLVGNNITNNRDGVGISLGSSSNNTLDGNNITNNECGIWLIRSSNNTFAGNNLTANNRDGISLFESFRNVLRNNSMVGNSYNFGVHGWESQVFVNDVDQSNTVDGKPIYYWINRQNMAIPSDAGYVALVNSENITVNGLELKNNFQGILLANTSNSKIAANNIANNWYGIYLWYSSNNTLDGNSIVNNHLGIYFWYAWYSSDNSICHNNFVNNTIQVDTGYSVNIWDDGYPSGGNYWSDYDGIDTDQDGIGDTEYIIDENNADNHPLMGIFSDFSISWEEKTYHITTISNSTISNFRFNASQSMISFNVTGPDHTLGFCRITIPNIIVQDLWQGNYTVLLNGEPWPFRNWTDATNTYIYINYTHSERQITIIPEFPSALIPPLLMVLGILTIAFAKRRPLRKPKT